MSVKVLFFASLRERLGKGQQLLDVNGSACVADIWRLSSGESNMPENVLVSVNQEYADADTLVASGDEVAFFPPVTGG